jgi:hypothetical protein
MKVRSGNAGLRYEEEITSSVIHLLQQKIAYPNQTCRTARTAFPKAFNTVLSSGLTLQIVNPHALSTQFPPGSLGPRGTTAARRCAASQTWRKNDITSDGSLYFCVQFMPGGLVSGDNSGIGQMRSFFGEFLYTRWRLDATNLLPSAALSCGALESSPSPIGPTMGMLNYTLYWVTTLPDSTLAEKADTGLVSVSDWN